jgi:ADP-ribose pyrophosphatase YjhB (NUDIX family)
MDEKYAKGSHCSFCGQAFDADVSWPRRCGRCGNTSYRNPLPVCVVLVPVEDGLLLVRRSIPPREGMLALPGGFINFGESWQQAGAREVFEETGVTVAPESVRLYDVRSAPDGTLLIFGLANRLSVADLPPFVRNSEVSETVVATAPVELAFPLHTQVAARFWEEYLS